jgi:uncharacterized protein YbjT (DUF2867 family)
MSDKKAIAVVGATGAQGGGLARAILDNPDGEFVLRAITRNPDSDKARALAEAGGEVVAADLDDEESLVRALDGAYGAFFVTNFWEHFSPEQETAQIGNLARAAKRAGLKHVIWSTLEDTREWVPLDDDRMPTLMENYKVPHFDAKGAGNALFAEAGVPTTNLLTSFYWDNLIGFGMGPAKGPDGNYGFTLPTGETRVPGIAVEDIGRCALGIFQRGDEFIGRTVGIAGEHLTGAEMAAAIGKAMGLEVGHNAVEPAAYREFGFPGAEDLGNMFQFWQDFEDDFRRPRDIAFSRSLNPRLQTFEQWLDANADNIPLDE